MAAGFGYRNYRQPTAPDPAAVGQRLLEQSQGPQMAPEAAPMMAEAGPEPDPHAMGAETGWPSASEAALRAAIVRGLSSKGTNERPPAPGNRHQLLRLGLTEEAIDLLNESGGANA